MKNSAWDHKLWSDKFDQLHVTEEAGPAWLHMKQMLDEKMPVVESSAPNTQGKLNNIQLFYLLTVIAIVAIVILSIVYRQKNPIVNPPKTKKHQSATIENPALPIDTNATDNKLADTVYTETVKAWQKRLVDQTSNLSDPILYAENENRTGYGTTSVSNQTQSGHNGKTQLLPSGDELSRAQLLSEKSNYLPAPVLASENSITPTFYNTNLNITTSTYSDLASGTTMAQSLASKKIKTSSKRQKPLKEKTEKKKVQQPWLSYGVTAGTSLGQMPNQFFGANASVKIYKRFGINPALIFHQNRNISGSIVHPSYFRPDSIAPFSISDSRTIDLLSIPLNIELKLSNSISIKAGPVINILQKQYQINTKIGSMPDKKDTLNQSLNVNRALQQTQFSAGSLGLSFGAGYQYRGFNLSASYVRDLKNYTVTSPLGNYQTHFQAFQLALGYQFNTAKKPKTRTKTFE